MSNTNLVIITGPSGFGKSKVLKEVINRNPDHVKIIAHTDRPIGDKVEGVDFHFISEEDFTKMIEDEEFLEWQRVQTTGYRYGKTKKAIEDAFANNKGKTVFTVVNIINLPVFKRYYPNAKSIFIDVKDSAFLVDYLKNQSGITSEEELDRRIKYATEERRRRHLADYIINMKDTLDETVDEVCKIVEKN